MSFPNTYDIIHEELTKGYDIAIRLSHLLQEASTTEVNSSTVNLVSEVTSSFTRALISLKHEGLQKKMEMPRKLSRKRCYQRSSQPYLWRMNKAKTLNDGHSWRKYGQKPIQDAKFPRSYFRCRHKADQNCSATRQVQQSEEDPSVFLITYFGEHTCTKDTSKLLSTILKQEEDNSKLIIDFSSGTSMTSSKYESDENREFVVSSTTSNENTDNLFSSFGELETQGAEDVTSMESFGWITDWEMMNDSFQYDVGLFGFEHMQDEWLI